MSKVAEAFNKLAKWRAVFAGWQLGTRPANDPECQAVRDHREVTVFLRAEVNALTRIMLEAKLITPEQLNQIMAEEAEHLNAMYERKFPGMRAEEYGIHYTLPEAANTMKGWKP